MMNEPDVTLTVKRNELCDLMLACTCARFSSNDGGKKWAELHNKLEEILEQFDKENGIGYISAE